jgi:hypothetical protein
MLIMVELHSDGQGACVAADAVQLGLGQLVAQCVRVVSFRLLVRAGVHTHLALPPCHTLCPSTCLTNTSDVKIEAG